MQGFAAIEAVRDPLELRNRIKRTCYGFDKVKFCALAQAIKRTTIFYQRAGMSNEEYNKKFDVF